MSNRDGYTATTMYVWGRKERGEVQWDIKEGGNIPPDVLAAIKGSWCMLCGDWIADQDGYCFCQRDD